MTDPRPGVRLSGLGLAALAFLITRLLVARSVQTDVGTFVLAGLVPLSAGLGLALFGVAIAIGAVSRQYARTVWTWAVIGTMAMVVVLAITAFHTILAGEDLELFRESGILVANVLLGGAILGTIVGDRTAKHRRTNEQLIQYAERAMLVNRLLRHEILNAVAVVKGYAASGEDAVDEKADVIRESTEQIEHTVEHVGEFAGTSGDLSPVDLTGAIERVLDGLPEGSDVTVDAELTSPAMVRADGRLDLLLAELLENALEHAGPDADVSLSVDRSPRSIALTVADDGPGLPTTAQGVLAARSLPEYDDPTVGYGLQMVRLLVQHYGGSVSARTGEDGTSVTVTLQRTPEHTTAPLALGVPRDDIYRASVAALVAAVVMGYLMQALAGVMPVIGSLYGVESLLVGWVTHVFHSLVFGLLFAGGCTLPYLRRATRTPAGLVGLGMGWGVVLWLVAAGIVMPVWLLAVGVPATVPSLRPVGLLTHLVWGAVLGGGYAVLPDASRLRQRVADRFPELTR